MFTYAYFQSIEKINCSFCNRSINGKVLLDLNNTLANFICTKCFATKYIWCNNCATLELKPQACKDAFIKENSFTPALELLGAKKDKDLLVGFELEVESANEDPYYGAKKLQLVMDNIYIKHDGSIRNGFEIVTHPMSYDYIKSYDWSPMFVLSKHGYKSYNTDSCGLHVHLSRKSFTLLHLYKFMSFFYNPFNTNFLYKLSRRKEDRLNQWSSTSSYGDSSRFRKAIIKDVKGHRNSVGKYTACNNSHKDSVEIRLFRGTLHEDSLFGCIEFCVSLYYFTEFRKVGDVTYDKYIQWLSENKKQYPRAHLLIEKVTK